MERVFGVLRKWLKKDKFGNVVVGSNTIDAPDGQVTDTVLVGENTVVSKAKPGAPVEIRGNKLFGKNKIIIH